MNKNTLWFCVVLLIMYLALVFCEEAVESAVAAQDGKDINILQSDSTDLIEEGRTRRRHRFRQWGWHALAIAYIVKVKLVIVSFFVGSAVFLGLRYLMPQKCNNNNNNAMPEGPIVYEDPHASFSHHDHVPYSFDHDHDHGHDHIPYSFDHGHDHSSHFEHSFDSSSFEPYSAYSSGFSDMESTGVTSPGVMPSTAPETHRIGRRSVRKPRQVKIETHIGEILFAFLGLDTKACRRRFICEMEFRSKENPLSDMVFRMVGRGFFDKYTNAHNELGQANSFEECANVNSECVFAERETENETEEAENAVAAESNNNENDELVEKQDADNNVVEHEDMEEQNRANLKAERKGINIKLRRRGDRKLDIVAEHIMTQMEEHTNN